MIGIISKGHIISIIKICVASQIKDIRSLRACHRGIFAALGLRSNMNNAQRFGITHLCVSSNIVASGSCDQQTSHRAFCIAHQRCLRSVYGFAHLASVSHRHHHRTSSARLSNITRFAARHGHGGSGMVAALLWVTPLPATFYHLTPLPHTHTAVSPPPGARLRAFTAHFSYHRTAALPLPAAFTRTAHHAPFPHTLRTRYAPATFSTHYHTFARACLHIYRPVLHVIGLVAYAAPLSSFHFLRTFTAYLDCLPYGLSRD